jgi:hypothetical protein
MTTMNWNSWTKMMNRRRPMNRRRKKTSGCWKNLKNLLQVHILP